MGAAVMPGETARYRDQGEPRNLSAVQARVRQLAKDTGAEERRLRHRLGVVMLAEILDGVVLSEADERLLVKGGTALMLRFGLARSRFSKDLDAMLRGQIDPFIDRLRERGRTPHYGWTLTVAKVETINVPGIAAKPRRASVKMDFKGKPFSTVQLEISSAEGAAADEYDLVTATDLADLGFAAGTSVRQVLSVRYQVAQKLHACTTPRVDGKPNDRAHDLVDLALLEDDVRAHLVEVRAACVEIFEGRGTTAWPPVVSPEPDWPAQYAKAADGLDGVVPATLGDAVNAVGALVADIDAAR